MQRAIVVVSLMFSIVLSQAPLAHAADLLARPPRVSFGARDVGTESAPRQVTLTNDTDKPTSVYAVGVGANFKIVSLTCFDGPLLPGDHCVVRVAFAPTSSGTFVSALRVQYCFLGTDPLCPGAPDDQVRLIDVPLAGRGR